MNVTTSPSSLIVYVYSHRCVYYVHACYYGTVTSTINWSDSYVWVKEAGTLLHQSCKLHAICRLPRYTNMSVRTTGVTTPTPTPHPPPPHPRRQHFNGQLDPMDPVTILHLLFTHPSSSSCSSIDRYRSLEISRLGYIL